MKHITFRLRPGYLLKEEIEQRAIAHHVKAGVLLSIIGGLENAVLCMAASEPSNQIVKHWDEPFEIVAGTGTIAEAGCHIHVALSDRQGRVIGGHLKDGCRVKYTAEIVIGVFDDVAYARRPDAETGYDELEVLPV